MKFLFLVAIFSLAGVISSFSASALSDGVYSANLFGNCSTLTITKGGKALHYKTGPCGKTATWASKATYNGKVIRIQQATCTVTSATPSSISCDWQLGAYKASPTFQRR